MPNSIKIYISKIVALHNCAACVLLHVLLHACCYVFGGHCTTYSTCWCFVGSLRMARDIILYLNSAVYADGVCHNVAFSLSIKPRKEASR